MNDQDQLIIILNAIGYNINMEEVNAVSKTYKKKKGKCVCFSRVSTLGQDLDQQINFILQEAHRFGYKDDDIIQISYKESGVLLDEIERRGINDLKNIIEKEPIECVVIYEISRLSRKPKVLYSVRDYLIEHDVNLICLKPYMRLLDDDGKMSQTAAILFSLFGSLAESEAMISKERMMRGRIAKREQLKYIGGNVMLGYTWDKDTDKIYINEAERDVVVEIFTRYANGESKRQIAKDLVDRGQLRYDNYSTACVMLGRMIRRSEYAGIKLNTYDYPPIISQELWHKVRQVAESKNKFKVRIQGLYYLQGIIHWKFNGMLLSPAKGGVQYRAWNENTNSGVLINMDYIESVAWHFAVEYKKRISGPEKLKIIQSLLEQMMHNNQKMQQTIIEHKSIEKTIERINERVVKGKMADEQGDRLIAEQQERIKELDSNMLKYAETTKQITSQLDNIRHGVEDYSMMNEQQKNTLIRQCIKRIDIEKDGITSKGRLIDIYYMDGGVTKLHMTKYWNYFNTYQILGNKEISIEIELIKRFERKKYGKRLK